MKERHSREEELAIAESAERQMQRELLAQRIEERLQKQDAAEEARAKGFGPYIAISRESGSGGGAIARLVGEKLGWDVLDKELLDQMADSYQIPRDALELVDESTANWVHETMGKWLDRNVIEQQTYVRHLGTIVVVAAKHGNVIVVGRGAQFLLPRDKGLTVRIIAPEPYRIDQTMKRRGLGREQAKRYVEQTERERRDFVRRYFNHDVSALDLYDLVINAEKIGPQGAAALIVHAFENWFKEKSSDH